MSSWMTGKTIKAHDSDELQAASSREELMRNYSATEEMTLDYSKNFKSLNHYASDELKRLPASFKEDLLNLPKSDRVSIYKHMNEAFSEEAVEAAGGWYEFMSKSQYKTVGNIAENLVRGTVMTSRLRAKADKSPAATGKKAAGLIGDDDIEMQSLLAKNDPDLDARAAKNAQAQKLAQEMEKQFAKDALDDKAAREAIKELDALRGRGGDYPADNILGELQDILAGYTDKAKPTEDDEMDKLLAELDALLDSEDDDLLPGDDDGGLLEDDHEDIYGDGHGEYVGEAGAVEMQEIKPMAPPPVEMQEIKPMAPPAAGPDVVDPFAASPGIVKTDAQLASIADGAGKKSFGGRVKGALKSVAKGAKGLFGKSKPGELAWAEPIMRGEAPEAPPALPDRGDFLEGKEEHTGATETLQGDYGMANEAGDATEMTTLLRKVLPLGRESGIKSFPTETMAVGGNGEFWITRQGLKNWMTESATGFIGSSLVIGPALQLVDALSGNQGWGSYINTGMNLATLLMTGNPTGIIFQGAIELWKAVAESQRKHKENLNPGRDRGKKMGYVRQGDKWVPAVFNTHYEDTGLWAGESSVTAQIGDTILYTQNQATYGADASVQPIVINADGSNIKHNLFRMSNEEYTNTTPDKFSDLYANDGTLAAMSRGDDLLPGSLEYVQRRDMLRNWYFADPGEVLTQHQSVLPEGSTPYEEQLDDWRQVMQISAGGGSTIGPLSSQLSEWDGSNALREVVNNGKIALRGGATGGESAAMWAATNYMGLRGLDAVDYRDALVKDANYYRSDMPENDWLLKTMFNKQVIALQAAQFNAAKSSGFEDRYGYDPYRDYHKTDKGPQLFQSPWQAQQMPQRSIAGEIAPWQSYEYQPIWASLYLDTSKSLETPSTRVAGAQRVW